MKRNERGDIGLVFGGIVALLILAFIVGRIGYTVAAYQNDQTWTCTVEDKESISKGDSGHEYRVYTDCGNFVVSDALFAGNFHASDTYRELEPGRTYELQTIGYRVPFLSFFPNILEAKEIA